jgi:hypothetical protein
MLFINPIFGQHQILKSEGEIPENIKSYFSILNSKIKSKGYSDKNSTENYLDYLFVSSGKVVFGTKYNQVLDKIGERIIDLNKLDLSSNIYIYKSNSFNAFITSKEDIFIPIGLLERTENEAQIAYIISRALAQIEKKHLLKRDIKDIDIYSFDSKTSENYFSAFEVKQQETADKIGLEYLIKSGYSKEAALDYFKIINSYHLVSNDRKIDLSIFEDESYKIHNTEVEIFDEENKYSQSDIDYLYPFLNKKVSETGVFKNAELSEIFTEPTKFINTIRQESFEKWLKEIKTREDKLHSQLSLNNDEIGKDFILFKNSEFTTLFKHFNTFKYRQIVDDRNFKRQVIQSLSEINSENKEMNIDHFLEGLYNLCIQKFERKVMQRELDISKTISKSKNERSIGKKAYISDFGNVLTNDFSIKELFTFTLKQLNKYPTERNKKFMETLWTLAFKEKIIEFDGLQHSESKSNKSVIDSLKLVLSNEKISNKKRVKIKRQIKKLNKSSGELSIEFINDFNNKSYYKWVESINKKALNNYDNITRQNSNDSKINFDNNKITLSSSDKVAIINPDIKVFKKNKLHIGKTLKYESIVQTELKRLLKNKDLDFEFFNKNDLLHNVDDYTTINELINFTDFYSQFSSGTLYKLLLIDKLKSQGFDKILLFHQTSNDRVKESLSFDKMLKGLYVLNVVGFPMAFFDFETSTNTDIDVIIIDLKNENYNSHERSINFKDRINKFSIGLHLNNLFNNLINSNE